MAQVTSSRIQIVNGLWRKTISKSYGLSHKTKQNTEMSEEEHSDRNCIILKSNKRQRNANRPANFRFRKRSLPSRSVATIPCLIECRVTGGSGITRGRLHVLLYFCVAIYICDIVWLVIVASMVNLWKSINWETNKMEYFLWTSGVE